MAKRPEEKGPAIATRGLSKRFGEIRALRDLTLEVPRGVTFGLLGPNGAGKTTLIRVLLGLTKPTSGTARVLGRSLPPTAVLPRLGYLPQEVAVYADLTVAENLALFGRLEGMKEEYIAKRTYAEALAIFSALWREARALNPDFPGDWEADLEPDLAVARAINGLPPTP